MAAVNTAFELSLDVAATLNFGAEHAGVPIVAAVHLINRTVATLSGAQLLLRIEPDLAVAAPIILPELRPGEPVDLGPQDVRLPAGKLRAVLEAEQAQLTWSLMADGVELVSGSSPLEVLPFNHWPGFRAPPGMLACYVLPNHPAVARLLVRVRDRLGVVTGDNALGGYQTRSRERVRAMAEALYTSVQGLDLSYIGVPASFEASGQKVRLPDQLLEQSMANCLDLTLLLAACCEQAGLAPLLVVFDGHALPGVWLTDERFPEGVVTDAARLRTLVALGDVLLFDSSTTVAAARPAFAEAERVAAALLADDAAFGCAIDVRVARREQFKPLPLRIVVEAEPVEAPSPAQTLLAEAVALPEEPAPLPPPVVPAPVQQRFRAWKDALLDLSLRNRLLNFRAGASVTLRAPTLAALEDRLGTDGFLELHPKPVQDAHDERDPGIVAARIDPAAEREALTADLARRIVHTQLAPADLFNRCVALDQDARAAREEGGANTLFIAIGVLRWFPAGEDGAVPREAPLLLVPVELGFDRSLRRVRVRRGAEDPMGNVTLSELVRRDFNIDLGFLANLPMDDAGVDVAALLAAVRNAIKAMPRWEVREDAHIGLFSFAKFLMWLDLHENAATLMENPVVRHIADAGASPFPDPAPAPDPAALDDTVAPSTLPTVVDADATQLSAVVAALRGRSFVLQGPPGTGKSQTITNLIAATLAEGRTVLFVSEKMAALEVVHRRLCAVGLGDYCLELHSNKTRKKQVIDALAASAERVAQPDVAGWDARTAELGRVRGDLNAYVRALHALTPIGVSFHAASARALDLAGAPVLPVADAVIVALDAERYAAALDAAERLAQSARGVLPCGAHPWRDVRVSAWSGAAEAEARARVEQAAAALEEVGVAYAALGAGGALVSREAAAGLADALRVVGEGDAPLGWGSAEWSALKARAQAWVADVRAARAEAAALDANYQPALRALPDLDALRRDFASWGRAFFLFALIFLWGQRQRMRAYVRGAMPGDLAIATDLGRAITLRDGEAARVAEGAAVAEQLGAVADPDRVEAMLARGDALRRAAERAAAVGHSLALPEGVTDAGRPALAAGAQRLQAALGALHASLVALDVALLAGTQTEDGVAALAERLNRWRSAFAAPSGTAVFRAACFYNGAAAAAEAVGLEGAVRALRADALAPDEVRAGVERALVTAIVARFRDAHPPLRDFDGAAHSERVVRFRSLDEEFIRFSRQRVLARLDARRPPASGGPAGGEPAILAREAKKQRAHLPIRRLLREIPNLLPRLKPCMLMSPLSIAQYLPADGRRFDLVVFDEASQIGTHDAIGAIARGQQVVIVGDSRQLPPTRFFSRAESETATVDDNDVIELESILDEAVASRLPQQMLGWHYRSRHEALIDFSNRHYYDGRLHVFPAARGRASDLGLQLTQVPNGVYEKGASRANPVEARLLVDWLVGELRSHAAGQRSYGVVTFSMPQQALIQQLIEQARARFPEIEPHFAEDYPERVFVKNLENVQGDERDVMAFSIGYGPDATGRVAMNFGPLNRTGGERRLNVAVTRARLLLRVFSTLTADQIDLSRTQAIGARHLKAFLQFAAERALLTEKDPTARAPDLSTGFEREVYDAVTAMGYRVATAVGCGGYRIDLAVVHPDRPEAYALGIECDGAPYASAATARDRDRLRHSVLGGLGWALHRVWSSDWWYDKAGETERIAAAIRAALAVPVIEPAAAVVAEASTPATADGASTTAVNSEPATPSKPATLAAGPRGTAVSESVAVSAPAAEPAGGPEAAAASETSAPPYVEAQLTAVSVDPESMYGKTALSGLVAAVREVVRVEAPVHVDELTRRVAGAYGVSRLSDRVRRRVREAVDAVAQSGGLVLRESFVWPAGVDPAAWSTVRGAGPREASLIPPEELAAAVEQVLHAALSCPEDALLREAARRFGIIRLGVKVTTAMQSGLAISVARGRARRVGDRVERVG